MKYVTLKVGYGEGHVRSIWELFPFSWSKQHVHWGFFLSQIHMVKLMYNRHLIPRKEKKSHPNWHYMWKILAPKFGSYSWATHWTPSHNKECQPNKIIPPGRSMQFLYGFMAHMVVGTTLHQQTHFCPCRLSPSGLWI